MDQLEERILQTVQLKNASKRLHIDHIQYDIKKGLYASQAPTCCNMFLS